MSNTDTNTNTNTDASATGAAGVLRIAASPEVIYDLISDVTRMGEWSPECVGADVPADAPVAPGYTFTGRNERGDQHWSTRCEVTAAERPHLLSFSAGDDDSPTTWTYELRSIGALTEVRESFDIEAMRDPDVAEQLAGRRDQLQADLATTLAALKVVAERENDR